MLEINLSAVVNNVDFHLKATPTTLYFLERDRIFLLFYTASSDLGLGGSEEFFGSPWAEHTAAELVRKDLMKHFCTTVQSASSSGSQLSAGKSWCSLELFIREIFVACVYTHGGCVILYLPGARNVHLVCKRCLFLSGKSWIGLNLDL